jgi:hypothetical protein
MPLYELPGQLKLVSTAEKWAEASGERSANGSEELLVCA